MAIAENIIQMFTLRVPIVVLVIGEGGSGGALGIGVGDRVLMMEHAYYSVISPEGCAAILWRDGERSPEAAEALKLTSKDLDQLGVIDEIVREPLGGAHRAPHVAMGAVKVVGADRVLLGSDMPCRSFGNGLGKVLGANISAAARRKILGQNAERLLGL